MVNDEGWQLVLPNRIGQTFNVTTAKCNRKTVSVFDLLG
jgi:hypothetical protein